MSNNVAINFRVSGGELSSYIDTIRQKQQKQSEEAVKNIQLQNNKFKDQQKLIADQISLIEKKNKVELQAEKNILIEKRKQEIASRNAQYDTKADAIYNNKKLTDDQKEKRLKKLEQERRSDERYTRDKYKDLLDENTAGSRELKISSVLQKEKEAEEKKQAAEMIQHFRSTLSKDYDPDYGVSQKDIDEHIAKTKNQGSAIFDDALITSAQQNVQGREQLKIIEEQINAIRKKNSLETEAQRNIQQNIKQRLLNENKAYFDNQRALADKFAPNPEIAAAQKEGINLAEKDREEKINSRYSENAASLREQAISRKRQNALAVEQIETIKQKANEQVKAVMSGDTKLADVFKNATTDEEKLIAHLTAEGVKAEKREKGSGRFGVVSGMVALDSVRQLISAGQMITQTQNGFDIIATAGNTFGRVAGGVIGGIIAGAFTDGIGVMAGAAVGSEIGGALGGTVGAFEQRKAIARQQYWQARNKYKGLTGEGDIDGNIDNMENVGISATQYLQLQTQYARMRGNRNVAGSTTTDAIYLDRGYGVDQSTTANIIEMMRSAKQSNQNLEKYIGGILEKGKNTYFKDGDTTFLNEFLNKFISLQKELLKNQTTVATGTTYDIMSRFNRIGGEFATSDPRSQGLMSTINNAISNPSGDFSKALMMYSIRKAHPEISNPFELMLQMQRGLNSDNLQSMFSTINKGNAPEWSKKMNLAAMTGLSRQLAFDDDLYGGLKKGVFKGKLDDGELSSTISDLQKRAEGNTSVMEKNEAEVNNGLLTDQAAERMADVFTQAITESLSGAVIELDNKQGRIILKSHELIKSQNNVKQQQNHEKISKDNAVAGSVFRNELNSGY